MSTDIATAVPFSVHFVANVIPDDCIFPDSARELWVVAYDHYIRAHIYALYCAIKGTQRGIESLTYMLGAIYYDGVIVPKDDVTALYYFKCAAEKSGNIHTNYLCAAMSLAPAGGIPQDLVGARYHLQLPFAEKYADSENIMRLIEMSEIYNAACAVATVNEKITNFTPGICKTCLENNDDADTSCLSALLGDSGSDSCQLRDI